MGEKSFTSRLEQGNENMLYLLNPLLISSQFLGQLWLFLLLPLVMPGSDSCPRP